MTPERPMGAGAFPKPVEPPASPKPDPAPLYAALDLGTNSCRMLIAQPKGTQFHVVDSFSKTVQLGAGLEASGRLSRGSMARTVQALRICQRKLDQHRVRRMRLVATEACRRARNARDFIREVHRETGLQLEIIQPEEEARLAVVSCAPLVSTRTEQLLVVDIGGGSTELVWIDLSSVPPHDRPRAIMRLHAGSSARQPVPGRQGGGLDQRAAGRGDAEGPVPRCRRRRRAVRPDELVLRGELADFSPYAHEQPREGFQIIGTSGTVTTVAASFLGLKRYDRNKVDGLRMTSTRSTG
jgi:exopolyphosphatase / guanosine-5'-triphosphate,3'-diphosphate pyrophosphatase